MPSDRTLRALRTAGDTGHRGTSGHAVVSMYLLLEQFIDFAAREGLLSNAFLVGGAVRDLLLCKALHDFDLAIRSDSLRVGKRFADQVNGTCVVLDSRFGITRVVKGGRFFDLCTMRGDSILADLGDRDLTINAMAIPLAEFGEQGPLMGLALKTANPEAHLIDPFRGLQDLRRGIIRMVSEENLTKDPLRLLRVYRFAATLGFTVDMATSSAVRRHASLIENSAGERVLEELRHLLQVPTSYRTIRDMERDSLLFHLFHELDGMPPDARAKIFRSYSFVEHILNNPSLYFPSDAGLIEGYFGSAHRVICLKLATLLPGDMAVSASERMKMSRAEERCIREIVMNPQRVEASAGTTAAEATRLFRDLGDAIYPLLVSTIASHFICQCAEDPVLVLCRNLLSLYHRDFLPRKRLLPLISGHDLIELFGLSPSPLFREILSRVDDLVLEGKISSREEALHFVKERLKLGTA